MTPKNRKFKNKINVFTKEPEKDMPANSGDSSGVHTKWIEDAAAKLSEMLNEVVKERYA